MDIKGALRRTLVAIGLSAAAATSAVGQNGDALAPTMHTLLEKTIFQFDVLTVDVAVDGRTRTRIGALVQGGEPTESVSDSIAQLALAAPHVVARIEFRRNISLNQFLGGIEEYMEQAVDGGLLPDADFRDIHARLPEWFAFLRDRRIKRGDLITYELHHDTLRTIYRGTEGVILMDQVLIGPKHRQGVLATYFAPRSDLRRGLIESLYRRQ